MPTCWVDLSHPLSPQTPPFPGDPPVEFTILDATDQSDDAPREHLNCSRLATCVHCGTHMDAPFHFFGSGRTIEQVDLDSCCGPALRIPLADRLDEQTGAVIEARHFESYQQQIRLRPRIILDVGWSRHWGQPRYFAEHPVLSRGAARCLADWGVRLLGVDFPSVDRPPHPAHLELLGRGVVIVENLTNLAALGDSRFDLFAIPLPLTGRDGSPVRALARLEATP